jgi:antitoxin (DNA-binding transcriptional repressor) of toxin-antitoxin stability system
VRTGYEDFRVRFSYWLDRVAAGEDVLLTRRGKLRVRLSPATEVAAISGAERPHAPDAAHSSHSPEITSSTPSG